MLFRIDDWLFHLLYGRGDSRGLTLAAIAFSAIGGGWAMLAIVPLGLQRRTRRFALWLACMLGATAVIVFSLKALFGRGRPFTVFQGLALALLDSPTDYSFPSGHAAGSFAFALFVARVLLDRRPRAWYALPASVALILVASCVAVSRVVLGFHFPLDVLAGAILGSVIGGVVGRRFSSV